MCQVLKNLFSVKSMSRFINLCGLFLLFSLCIYSCGTQKKAEYLQENNLGAGLRLAKANDYVPDVNSVQLKKDTLKIEDLSGKEVFLMKAVRDEDGEMVANDVIDAAVVTARFRNVAERHGKVDIEFQIIVPKEMQDSKWQLRFYPDMFIMADSVRLDPVIITGRDYRKTQLKGYELYNKWFNSIITDSAHFVRFRQLDIFISRNLPGIYQFKSDSSYVDEIVFESFFGVSEKEAIEHYTDHYAKMRNERKFGRRNKMFKKYVKSPIVTEGLRLDTILVNYDGDFVYNYVQTINTRPKLRKVDVVLSGDIWEQDKKIYTIPKSEPLTFYISSISAFVDNTERYLTKVIERRAEANTACYVVFDSGKSDIDLSLGENASELGRVRGNVLDLLRNATYDLDSIIVTSSSSPEGTVQMNRKLSERRSESISTYLRRYINHCQDSLAADAGFSVDEDGRIVHYEKIQIPFVSRSDGENWRMLDRLVQEDTLMTSAEKEEYFSLSDMVDVDRREKDMQSKSFYPYMRRSLYPRLRTVRFDFHLHRKGMIKDTVHTTVLDSVYMNGVQAIRDRDYETAVTLLRPYNDYNTAVAYCALDYNESAKQILVHLEKTAQVNYMLALLYARAGDDQNAVQCYLHSCQQDQSYVFRGNLDPEIAVLIKRYGLNKQEEDDVLF